MHKLSRTLLLTLGLATLAACGGGGSNNSNPAPFSIFVSPTSATVTVNGIRQFTAEARDSSGNVVSGIQFGWRSSDTNIAVSLGDGAFKGIAAGSVQVTANAGIVERAGQGVVNITSNVVVLSVTLAVEGTAAQGGPLAGASVSLRDARGQYAAASADRTGHFEIPVAGMTAPFLLRVATPDGRLLYGSAADLGTANLDPYTDLLVRDWYAAHGLDPDAAFAGNGPLPSAIGLQLLDQTLGHLLAPAYAAEGMTAPFNLLGTPFQADHTGFDKLLDDTRIDLRSGHIQAASETLELHADAGTGRLDWVGTGSSGALQVP